VLHVDRKGAVLGKDGRKMQISVVAPAGVANNRTVDIVDGHTVGKKEIDCTG